MALLVVGKQYTSRRVVYGRNIILFAFRWRAGAADADSTLLPEQQLPRRRALQSDIHRPWIRDDVSVRDSHFRSHRNHASSTDAGGTRPPFPTSVRVWFLGFSDWRDISKRVDLLRCGPSRRLVHVSAFDHSIPTGNRR